jgi:site-specific DNA-methyltransferase (adenine-specific)
MMKPYFTCQYGDLYCGDCLEVMPDLAKNGVKVDMVLTDPPYGTTQCKWDSVIPLEKMWGILQKVVAVNAGVLLFSAQPFTSILVSSNFSAYKYNWFWKKSRATGRLNAKKQPLRCVEEINVFQLNSFIRYFPQGLAPCNRLKGTGNPGAGKSDNYGSVKQGVYLQKQTGYPTQVLDFASVGKTQHPTQKPVALMEYLIRTYTNFGDTVLDFTIGSGTTAVAAVNTGRHFIGIEREEKYCEIAAKRILGVL